MNQQTEGYVKLKVMPIKQAQPFPLTNKIKLALSSFLFFFATITTISDDTQNDYHLHQPHHYMVNSIPSALAHRLTHTQHTHTYPLSDGSSVCKLTINQPHPKPRPPPEVHDAIRRSTNGSWRDVNFILSVAVT